MENQRSLFRQPSKLWRRVSGSQHGAAKPVKPAISQQRPTPNVLQKRRGPPGQISSSGKLIIAHWHEINSPTSRPPSFTRTLPTDMRTESFPRDSSQIQTAPWTVLLDAAQVHNIVMGFKPESTDEKWFIYSIGPDESGKLKVHFHRSWTGFKIAELYVVIDRREGHGKIVGIKWNASDQTNGMDEEEAKYMITTTCAWVLGVNFEYGGVS